MVIEVVGTESVNRMGCWVALLLTCSRKDGRDYIHRERRGVW